MSLVLWMYRQPIRSLYDPLLETVFKWRDNNGWPFVIERLKLSHIRILQSIAKTPSLHSPNNRQRLAITMDGIPKWIPHHLRMKIREGDNDAIRAILAILTVYRVIPCQGKLKLTTITDPFSGLSTTLQMSRLQYVHSLFQKVAKPKGLDTLLPLRTAGPNGKPSIMSAPLDAFALGQAGAGKLLYSLQLLSNYFESGIYRILHREMEIVSQWRVIKPDLKLGKLSFKEEAAGKVRVFAMLDVWSQSILEPIHNHMFSILKTIDNDGCWDQEKPLKRLMAKGLKNLYSFDLSAATDRLPIDLQVQVLSLIYNQEVALAWKSVLIDRPYIINLSDIKKFCSNFIFNRNMEYKDAPLFYESETFGNKGFKLKYAVGQPMGALSSWGVFSLTHHYIVQYCARQAGFTSWFDDYALLGDDIVIGHDKVAQIYQYTMVEILGVEINLSKSIISHNGYAEFAKRFISPSIDLTPIGAKNITQSLKSFANFPALLRDYVLKGGFADNASVRILLDSLTYNISKVSKKNLSSLLYVLIGPFGFVNTGPIDFKSVYSQAGIELGPYDMRLRTLGYAGDHLIPFIKDELREAWVNAQEKAIEKSVKIWKETTQITTVKGFLYNKKISPNLKALVPYGTIPSALMLPSFRSLRLRILESHLDRMLEEVPYISYPYSLPLAEGIRYMIKNIKDPIPEVSLIAKPRVVRPKFKPVNVNFFKRVRARMLAELKGKKSVLNE